MLVKALVITALVASAPIYVATNPQNPTDADPTEVDVTAHPGGAEAISFAGGRDTGQARIEQLQRELQAAQTRLENAENRIGDLENQLEESLDMLQDDDGHRHRNCAPSRRLMVQYQWMKKHGHEKRAGKSLTQFVKQVGDSNNNLNRVAWHLMTEKSTAGQFDDLALALCERMETRKHDLCHRRIDTIALAKFLNGDFETAITLQKKAIEKGGRSDDYRRRLRTYEAALKAHQPAAAPKKKSKPSLHDDD